MLPFPTLPDRLPQLRGRWMVAYVAIWVAVLPIAVAMPLAGSWLGYKDGAGGARREKALGFDLYDWRVQRVLGTEARAAGLRPGDRVVAVEGVPVADGRDFNAEFALRAKLSASEGQPVRLTVTTGTDPPRRIVLHHRAANARPFFQGTGWTAESLSLASALVPLLPWFVLLSGGVLLFARRRDPGAALFSLAFLVLALAASWIAPVLFRLGLSQVYPGISIAASWLLLWSLLLFPRGRFEPKWSVWVAVSPAVLRALNAVAPLPTLVNSAFALAIIGLTLVALVIRYRRETPADRRQWRWALLGIAAGFALILFLAAFYTPYVEAHNGDPVVAMWSWIISPGLLSLGFAVIAAGVLLSVLRFRIYAAQSAISRSLVYGTLTLSLLAIFAASEKVIELVGEEYFGESLGALAGGLAAAFAAVAMVPLHHRISHFVEQRLRRDLIALRRDLPRMIEAEAETGTPPDVALVALSAIARAVHAERGAIVDDGQMLASFGQADEDAEWPVTVPLGFTGTLILLLGTKPDDSLYDRDERDAIGDLAEPIARALRAARRNRALETRLDSIEQALETLRGSPRAQLSA